MSPRGISHRTPRTLAATLAITAASAISAHATPLVKLKASFSPDKLGRSTTVRFGFTFAVPEPLKTMELRLPAGMTFTHSQLGLEPCEPAMLQYAGTEGCPLDSRLGQGTAYAETPIGAPPNVREIPEGATVTALLGPIAENRMTALFWVEGISPLAYEKLFVGYIRKVKRPYGEALRVEVPLDIAWQEGPYVGVKHFASTIGPAGLHYTRTEHGHTIRFKPEGLDTPETCPPHGFPVAATFTWWTGGHAHASIRVPCPRA